jgi:3-oxoacyl-[acyl-carrier-protein] synthase-3
MSEYRSKILGLGAYLPSRVITNNDLTQWMETTHEWIVERTGIEERRWAEEGESGSGMGAKAAEQAIEEAGIDKKEIDLVIYSTLAPDHMFPGGGTFCAATLGLKNVPVIDVRQQCSGWIYSVAVADNFIRMGQYKNVLIVCSELQSPSLDKSTRGRNVTALFGDGAGAAVLGRATDDNSMILSTHLFADGHDAKILWMDRPAYGIGCQPQDEADKLDDAIWYPQMDGQRTFKHAVTKMPKAAMAALKANNVSAEDLDLVIPHQANLRINEFVLHKMMKLSPDQVHNNIQRYGNITSATIPVCFKEAIELGKAKRGDLVCHVAFGAGLTWGSVLMRY